MMMCPVVKGLSYTAAEVLMVLVNGESVLDWPEATVSDVLRKQTISRWWLCTMPLANLRLLFRHIEVWTNVARKSLREVMAMKRIVSHYGRPMK